LEERIASIIRVTRIGKLGTMLAITSDWNTPCAWIFRVEGLAKQEMSNKQLVRRGSTLLWDIRLLPHRAASHPRRQCSS
jgi:hypothetical protein